VRPAGQIRPAEVFCPARREYFSNNKLMFHVKMSFSVLAYQKVWPEGTEILFKLSADQKIAHHCSGGLRHLQVWPIFLSFLTVIKNSKVSLVHCKRCD
jgi:hypothetical protein